MEKTDLLRQVFEENGGVLRLLPTWVPRAFCRPGKRIKLHPDDYYALGAERGGIDERWFASTTHAENGPATPDDEGLSYVALGTGKDDKILLKDAIEEMGEEILGSYLWNKYHGWSMFSKFFDNLGPLPHHIHHRDEHAARVGCKGKPETYFFPSQVNNYGGEFDYTFLGLTPDTTKEQVKEALQNFTKGDNQLLGLSQAYKLLPDTGFDVPPGLLHAPGSLCTYEPQFASDVYAMYQSVLLGGHTVSEDLLWKNCPPEEIGNYDYLVDVIDWDLNVDPDLHKNRFMRPIPVRLVEAMEKEGYVEEWICYKSPLVSAKRLTVRPGAKVVIKDAAPYGLINLQGHGTIAGLPLETPTLIRYGEQTYDEYFVSASAAQKGIEIVNTSASEDIVMLKHFAENPDLPKGL